MFSYTTFLQKTCCKFDLSCKFKLYYNDVISTRSYRSVIEFDTVVNRAYSRCKQTVLDNTTGTKLSSAGITQPAEQYGNNCSVRVCNKLGVFSTYLICSFFLINSL